MRRIPQQGGDIGCQKKSPSQKLREVFAWEMQETIKKAQRVSLKNRGKNNCMIIHLKSRYDVSRRGRSTKGKKTCAMTVKEVVEPKKRTTGGKPGIGQRLRG